MENKNDFSSMIIDEGFFDIYKVSYEELDELQVHLETKQEELRAQIDKILEEG